MFYLVENLEKILELMAMDIKIGAAVVMVGMLGVVGTFCYALVRKLLR